jgi:hypothetical protein
VSFDLKLTLIIILIGVIFLYPIVEAYAAGRGALRSAHVSKSIGREPLTVSKQFKDSMGSTKIQETMQQTPGKEHIREKFKEPISKMNPRNENFAKVYLNTFLNLSFKSLKDVISIVPNLLDISLVWSPMR